jgi:predicted phage terminase large subunit-like protein
MGNDTFNAQYLQAPVPETGNMLKREWLRKYDVLPTRQEGDQIVQSWDTAMKATETSNYSVCLTFLVRNKNEYYLVDSYRERLEFPELAKLVVAHARKWRASAILIEDKVSGTSLIQTVKRTGLQGVIPVKPSTDKASRMYGQTPKLEAGSLFPPKLASWLADFLTEYLAFPKGRHDDQIDALSQFLEWRGNRENDVFDFDFGHDTTSVPSVESILASFGR